jgi:N-methylhydantoinase B/oxoprolinase/acetone carboxylase alpha subunit
MTQTLDRVELAVLSARFKGIVKQMANTLFRTGRAGVVNTAHDFSCCIITADGEFLTMADSLPIHVMRGSDRQAQVMKEFHPELFAGDAFLHNSPYHGNTHAGDFGVLVPVVDRDGVHRFTCVAKAHISDVGNSIPTTQYASARDIYEEGALFFAATQVQRGYENIDDIIRMCRMRIRQPDQWYGDYLAILGSVRTGERRILELGEEVGWDTLETFTREWFDYSERMMASALSRFPRGEVTVGTMHDPFPRTPPEGVPLQATVSVDPDEGRIEVDLRDNPDCLPNGLNQSWATITTHAQIPIFNSVGHTVPINAGSFRRINIILRENCCVGIPRHPASCSVATTCLGNRIGGCVARALAELGEGVGHAEVGPIQTPAFAIITGNDPRHDNETYINQLILGCAGGAGFPGADGWLTVGDSGASGMVHWDSIESDEVQYPIYIYERRIVTDGEGAGEFRGAPGTFVEYGPIPGSHLHAVYASDGCVHPAAGASGGLSGGCGAQYRRAEDGSLDPQGPMGPIEVDAGESIVCVGTGGGGYGRPDRRVVERVRKDVVEGWITPDRAHRVYGVAIDSDGTVDERATEARRAELARTEPKDEVRTASIGPRVI